MKIAIKNTVLETIQTGGSNAHYVKLFEDQVRQTPDAIAVCYRNQVLTYQD